MWAGSEPKQEQHNNRPYRYVYTTVRDTRFGNLLTWHIYLLAHAAPSRQHSEWTVSKYHLLMQLITLASSSNQERKSRFVPPFNAAADASCSHSNGPIRRERGLASKSNRTAGLFFIFMIFLFMMDLFISATTMMAFSFVACVPFPGRCLRAMDLEYCEHFSLGLSAYSQQFAWALNHGNITDRVPFWLSWPRQKEKGKRKLSRSRWNSSPKKEEMASQLYRCNNQIYIIVSEILLPLELNTRQQAIQHIFWFFTVG